MADKTQQCYIKKANAVTYCTEKQSKIN